MESRFDPALARKLLVPYVEQLRSRGYTDLREKVTRAEQETFEVRAPDGTLYQFEILFHWDDEANGDIRVIASAFHDPRGDMVNDGFVLSPDGKFLGDVRAQVDELRQFAQDRSLISLRRAGVDENKIQGFVLGSSDRLVLLQYVYDFNLDGLMVLRTEDISEVTRSKTDAFQERLLADEGLLSRVPFDYSVDLSSWGSVIAGLSGLHPLLILECELMEEPDFIVGRVLEIGANDVTVRYFTGAANWLEEPVKVRYDDITSCQVNTNYVNIYQRYFERNAP
ncbi:hypothetical protein [Ramlibacter tataouinensis]|uniref:Uncharacterized protein n=1 Tax=Ramlibacter tataouinensis (strain ATCC BAA-407 / DSM 14655 / LMG 21543 / TTB310) TaxID=365046 RepID=F5Y3L7_RAMTT|nr:hypothetical protein [Ramlibacter tataouinensis]AEG92491.1 hypothetical protein Rta_14050 [Ramlibacter tataouinensis TTB310]